MNVHLLILGFAAWKGMRPEDADVMRLSIVPTLRNTERWEIRHVEELLDTMLHWKPGVVHAKMIGPV